MYLVAEVSLGAIIELDTRVRASELSSTWDPRDGRALIKQVHWTEILDTLFHYQPHSKNLPFVITRD